MQYIVIGADPDTGEECRTIIEAGGRAEADQKAAELGWIIASVAANPEGRSVNDDVAAALDYMTPNSKSVAAAPHGDHAPSYSDIQKGARSDPGASSGSVGGDIDGQN